MFLYTKFISHKLCTPCNMLQRDMLSTFCSQLSIFFCFVPSIIHMCIIQCLINICRIFQKDQASILLLRFRQFPEAGFLLPELLSRSAFRLAPSFSLHIPPILLSDILSSQRLPQLRQFATSDHISIRLFGCQLLNPHSRFAQ